MKKLFIILFIVNAPFALAMNKSEKEQEAWDTLTQNSIELLELCNYRLYKTAISSESLDKAIDCCQENINKASQHLMTLRTPEKYLKYLIAKKDLFKAWTKKLIGNTYYFSNNEQPLVDDCLTFFKQSDYVKAFCPTTRNYIIFSILYEERKKISQSALHIIELDIKLFEMPATPKSYNNNSDEIMRE